MVHVAGNPKWPGHQFGYEVQFVGGQAPEVVGSITDETTGGSRRDRSLLRRHAGNPEWDDATEDALASEPTMKAAGIRVDRPRWR
jgi:hypothetical protein